MKYGIIDSMKNASEIAKENMLVSVDRSFFCISGLRETVRSIILATNQGRFREHLPMATTGGKLEVRSIDMLLNRKNSKLV